MADDRMTADEARGLLAGMTPGTLSVERVVGTRRLAVPQGDELALVIRDAPREFEGAMYSLEVCRGMDGPTREGNAAALASVKRALDAVVALAAQHAADVAAASRSTREACAAQLRARAECLRRYAADAVRVVDAAEYAHDAREVDACAAIVASVALAAPTGGGE